MLPVNFPDPDAKKKLTDSWVAIAPYAVPPLTASAAMIPVFRDMIIKTELQKGLSIPCISLRIGLQQGLKAAPATGLLVGSQKVIQEVLEKVLVSESEKPSVGSACASSAITGVLTSPVVAVFNGKTLGWGARESLRRLDMRQCAVIAVQETAFVGGLSLAAIVSQSMKRQLGDNAAVDCAGAFIAGAAGSLAGHPANTTLTRWQARLPTPTIKEIMRGAIPRARGVGCISVALKLAKDYLMPQTAVQDK